MARTALTPVVRGRFQTVAPVASAADYTYEVADSVNGNYFTWTGRELLLVHNANVGAKTITIDGVADAFGRDGAITAYSMGAGEYALFDLTGRWCCQSDGTVYIDTEHNDVNLCVVTLKKFQE